VIDASSPYHGKRSQGVEVGMVAVLVSIHIYLICQLHIVCGYCFTNMLGGGGVAVFFFLKNI
jgi:hypothetical protein